MARSCFAGSTRGVDAQVRLEDIALSRDAAWVWVDVVGAPEHTVATLADEFDLHPSGRGVEHPARAKLDIYPDGLFMVWLTPER